MMRGYAIGLGAGTQAYTGLSGVLILGTPGELGRALYMGAGWAINIVVAEWIIRRRPKGQIRAPATAVPRLAAS